MHGIGGPAIGRVWELRANARIGRFEGVEICIDDASVSRVHAELKLTPLGWRLIDMGSTNGTLVNGTRITKAQWPLHRKDVVVVGGVSLRIEEIEAEAVSQSPVPVPPASDDLGLFQGLNLWVEATTKSNWQDALIDVARERELAGQTREMFVTLLDTSRHLVHLEREDDFLSHVLEDAVNVLRAQGGAIVLAEGTPPVLKPRLQVEREKSAGRPRAYSQSLAERVFERGCSALCRTFEEDPQLSKSPSIFEGNMASILCVLLHTPRRRLGVLHLDRPAHIAPFENGDLAFANALAAQISIGIESAQMIRKQRETFFETVNVLGQVIELRDAYTGGHTMRVTHYATLIAERMGLPSDQLELVRLGAPLHDIGKIGIADSILRKEGNLTDSEREQMRGHTVLGDQILKSHPGLMKVAAIARSHHERHDGLGYPDGLKGDAIPLLARVVSVADTFDAMTSDRPYRARMKLQDALAFMAAESEKQFHPEVLKVFLEFASSLSIAP